MTVFLRLEDEDGKPVAHPESGGIDKKSRPVVKAGGAAVGGGDSKEGAKVEPTASAAADGEGPESDKGHTGGGILSSFARRIRHSSSSGPQEESAGSSSSAQPETVETNIRDDGLLQVQGKEVKRVLYTANVGDARAVLW